MWVKFDDQTPADEAVDKLSDGAFRLWFSAICYAQSELTDGHVSASRMRRLTPRFKPSQITELVDLGLLSKIGDGYDIRNFTRYNKTREYWEAEKEKANKRQAKSRANRRGQDHA